MKDLFGDEVTGRLPGPKDSPLKGRKLKTGYAAPPGTGPEGETCRTCDHRVRHSSGDKGWYKCELVEVPGHKATDIKLRSPACLKWEEEK